MWHSRLGCSFTNTWMHKTKIRQLVQTAWSYISSLNTQHQQLPDRQTELTFQIQSLHAMRRTVETVQSLRSFVFVLLSDVWLQTTKELQTLAPLNVPWTSAIIHIRTTRCSSSGICLEWERLDSGKTNIWKRSRSEPTTVIGRRSNGLFCGSCGLSVACELAPSMRAFDIRFDTTVERGPIFLTRPNLTHYA